jgi:hypothetical protein
VKRLLLAIGLTTATLAGCESGSALTSVPVTYTFENVRTDPARDEWGAIREILRKRGSGEPTVSSSESRTVGSMKIANYRAAVVLPNLKALDAIQQDLESLAEGRDENARSRFTLVSLNAGYRSNVVAATASTMISGFATPGYRVKVYAAPGDAPATVSAGRGGIWTVRLEGEPVSGWVYGVAEDPAGKDQPAYFRVNILTRAQERVDAATFAKVVGVEGKAPAAKSQTPVGETDQARDHERQTIEAKRKAEDEARRRKLEQEDASRRNRKF